jgi:glycine oxidase
VSSTTAGQSRFTHAIVIGDGVIGLAIALELADRGIGCRMIGARRSGIASTAAAGLLAPSVAALPAAVRPFFYASLDRFPAFLARLHGQDPMLATIEGVIEIPRDDDEARTAVSPARHLDAAELAGLEPALAHLPSAILHPHDAAIDNVRLTAALTRAVATMPGIDVVADDPVTEIHCEPAELSVHTASGFRFHAGTVVLAAGAWSSSILGLPRRLPVSPLKGQMLAVRGDVLRHGIMSPHVYLVPRNSETLIGATSEHAGFDVSTTDEALAALRAAAVELCPALATCAVVRAWAGVRPVTPDLLPILGRDPACPGLVYACGHSRNGILLAPATAQAIGALVAGHVSPLDIDPFNPSRFPAASAIT